MKVSEPPFTRGLDLEQFRDTPLITHHPCHTQSVERMVALTSDVTAKLSGQLRQIGEALNVIAARRFLPGRVTKNIEQKLISFFDRLNSGIDIFELLANFSKEHM